MEARKHYRGDRRLALTFSPPFEVGARRDKSLAESTARTSGSTGESRFLVTSLAVIALFTAGQATLRAGDPEKTKIDQSIDRGLRFLESVQEPDGCWISAKQRHPAVTSLAVMSFLSAGHLPGEGKFEKTIDRAVRWVLDQQTEAGLFASDGGHEMYHHGICTLMLAEVAGMTDAETAKKLRPRLEKAVRLILQAQRTATLSKGGWRYKVDSPDADLSITGWQILALRGARSLGCDIPVEKLDWAMEFVEKCRDFRTGAYTYIPGGKSTAACTATAILCRELANDGPPERESLDSAGYLLRNLPRPGQEHFFYGMYYSSQALFQLRKNYWHLYRPHLHQTILGTQLPNGAWLADDGFGPAYGTSMAILSLTVEHQLLPIYQRMEGVARGTEKKKTR